MSIRNIRATGALGQQVEISQRQPVKRRINWGWGGYAALAAVVLLVAGNARAQSINTIPQWNGTSYEYPFGAPDTTTYGQTISLSNSEYLNDFTFEIRAETAGNLIVATPCVYAWNGTNATGPALYTGSPISITSTAFTPFTFNTGQTLLNAGQYVLFLTNSDTADYNASTNGALSDWEIETNNPYLGGDFVYYNNGHNASLLTSHTWDQTGAGTDLAFSATLTPVPEPASLSLLTVGSFALLRRRRMTR